MAHIILKQNTPPPASTAKSGEYYDRCPHDGCVEVERSYKSGGRDGRKQEHLDWSMYHADPRKGGCGTSWTRDTKQGAERARQRGINPKWLTQAASTDRTTFTPTDTYRDNYARIFGHD